MKTNSPIILAIDPGFERLGIAVLEKQKGQKERLMYSECFKTNSKLPFPERLRLIGEKIENTISEYSPKILSIEKLYLTNNQKTGMGVSEARGVIIYSASRNGLSIFEYTPPQIKVAVTGYGKADKKMVMDMVPRLIHIEKKINSDDELDAIAIGITCIACEKL